MSNGNGSSSHGITFLGALQVLFIGLKLAGVIDWSWPVVFWPIILEVAIILVIAFIVAVFEAIDRW